MSMTLELLSQRVEILEKQVAALMADKTTEPDKKSKKEKKKQKTKLLSIINKIEGLADIEMLSISIDEKNTS